MLAVPVEARGFAMAFNVIINHVLGDVPSPIIAGRIIIINNIFFK